MEACRSTLRSALKHHRFMYRAFDLHHIAPVPWKNGGGLTQEIVCWPPGAGMSEFQWRVSVASIDAGGPFSVFPGVDRVILLLEGGGVRLLSPGQGLDRRLEHYRPLQFSGDHPCDCTLLGGASRDFNVMTRRGAVVADVQVFAGAATGSGSHGLLFVAAGTWSLHSRGHGTLGTQAGICWAGEPLTWTATPLDDEARLVAVHIRECSASRSPR